MKSPRDVRILIIGTGGVGAPVALALAEAGVGELTICDDDRVEQMNLHRQILFSDADVGRDKLEATESALMARRPDLRVRRVSSRVLPANALDIVRMADVVVDATDNFASRFVIADACRLSAVAVVHAAAVGWMGTAMSVSARGTPCYRCLFEDLPGEGAPDCASAGVVGPVCGVIGALAAEMALDLALARGRLSGRIATFDGLGDTLRLIEVPARATCPLCGPEQTLCALDENRYHMVLDTGGLP